MTAASDAIIIRSRQFRSSRTLFFCQSYAAERDRLWRDRLRPHPQMRRDRPQQMLDEHRHVRQTSRSGGTRSVWTFSR